MPFEPLNKIVSKVVLLKADNIDTDRIIPARYLKSVSSDGFGKNLFHDWRYRPDGTPEPDFVLNTPEGVGQILLTGANFGCGSSREHAAWALYQYGFRVIISSGFADIFRTNALNNGLLPVEVSILQLKALMEQYVSDPEQSWTVDLNAQLLLTSGRTADSTSGADQSASENTCSDCINFDINPLRKKCLLSGSDLIDFLAKMKPEIAEFETRLKTK